MITINTIFNSGTGINKIVQFDQVESRDFETWPTNLNSRARLNTCTAELRFIIFENTQ